MEHSIPSLFLPSLSLQVNSLIRARANTLTSRHPTPTPQVCFQPTDCFGLRPFPSHVEASGPMQRSERGRGPDSWHSAGSLEQKEPNHLYLVYASDVVDCYCIGGESKEKYVGVVVNANILHLGFTK